ncbi:MAG: NfeD family protein [bacterium]|jgi:membrane protein implicated in regulation of membrane protease activity
MDFLTWALLITGGLLLVLDLIIPSGGVLSGSGVALLVITGLNHLGVSGWVQALVFFPVMVGSTLILYKLASAGGSYLERWLVPTRLQSGVDALPGSTGVMLDAAHAQVRGDRWLVLCDEPLETGDPISVLSLEGASLRVEKIQEKEES